MLFLPQNRDLMMKLVLTYMDND